jgi:hypothetical protein
MFHRLRSKIPVIALNVIALGSLQFQPPMPTSGGDLFRGTMLVNIGSYGGGRLYSGCAEASSERPYFGPSLTPPYRDPDRAKPVIYFIPALLRRIGPLDGPVGEPVKRRRGL